MKYFPLKTVLFCILVIPLLFTATLTHLEQYLNISYKYKIENHIAAHINELLDGSITIYNAVDKNIRNFLETDMLVKILHLQPDIKVMVKGGSLIYSKCGIEGIDSTKNDTFWNSDDVLKDTQKSNNSDIANYNEQVHRIDTIRQNKKIMDTGLEVRVSMAIRENPLLSNLILLIYMGFSLLIFGYFYKKAISKVITDDFQRGETIARLVKYEKEYLDKLETLKTERELLAQKLTEAKAYHQEERRIASIAEEELVDEIVQLEKRLDENISLQKEKEQEIENLKSQLEKVERRKGSSKKRKSIDVIEKRFGNLYKNIEMNRKTLTGLLDLDDDMQIKAEEVIHQLNDDPSGVTVKRKVFAGKKNKTASFEVLFAYNGRLYFRNLEGNRIEILIVGTKNTQDKDMEFLHYI